MKPPRISQPVSTSLQTDAAVSTLIGVILMVALVLVLTAILSTLLFGFITPAQKSAYLTADAQYSTQNGYPVITLLHRGGDTGQLPGSGKGYPLLVQISSEGSSETACPDPVGLVWAPGSTLYITRTSTGYNVTNALGWIPASSQTFPGNEVTVSVIDTSNNLPVYSKKLTIAGSSGNVITTLTQNVTLIPTATANVTPTATATTATRTITVIWSPGGYGYGSLSPPTPLTNSQEVRIPRGSSKTIYFVPNANRAVLTIKLDGVTVYTGSSTGSTTSYMVSNVVEDRTLIATFG
ncbi:MAG: type IV pilin N-terminal domain-containing protein [Methanoregula sp.]|nr:type IV pilin N-terminal domain-containing protein [Methanoregula sp.]